jgi:hypothetical protein
MGNDLRRLRSELDIVRKESEDIRTTFLKSIQDIHNDYEKSIALLH